MLMTIPEHLTDYASKLASTLQRLPIEDIAALAQAIAACRDERRAIYLCGNGGSAANAIHIADDLLFMGGAKVEALSANTAVVTCIANDAGYERIFADQINVKANPGDLLIALSGSGNSPNIIAALEAGNARGMQTFAVLGLSGGRCLVLAHHAVHFDGADMQVAEDLQLIVGHMCVQWISAKPTSIGEVSGSLSGPCTIS